MSRIYLLVFALFTLVGLIGGSIAQFVQENLQCRTSGYRIDEFLAYCNSEHYADYDHGALFYGIPLDVRQNIRQAKVLFLGNSLTLAAFSSVTTREYFKALQVPFFILGWSYGEWSHFGLAVMQRWEVAPKVLVINTDPYFSAKLSAPAQDILARHPASLWTFFLKTSFQPIHRSICEALPGVCSQSGRSIFRSSEDGEWDWIPSYVENRALPIDLTSRQIPSEEVMNEARVLGERFLDSVKINRHCVIFTGIPSSNTDSPPLAARLSRELGTSLIQPDLENLMTAEGSHFNRESAERWSEAFLRAMTPVLQECLRDNAGNIIR